MEYNKPDRLDSFVRKELIIFRQVYIAGSFSKAALVLRTTQSAISKSVLALEKEKNLRLFVRGKSGTKPTDAGNTLFKQIEVIRNTLQKDTIPSFAPSPILLGCHPSIGLDFISLKALEHFKSPGAQIEFKLQPSRLNVVDVLNRVIDLAYVVNPTRHQNLTIRKISKQDVMLFESNMESSQKKILIHPDQVGLVKSLKALDESNVVEVSDYELIASLVSKSRGYLAGVLPQHIALRYGLKPASKVLHVASVCLIYRADHVNASQFRTFF